MERSLLSATLFIAIITNGGRLIADGVLARAIVPSNTLSLRLSTSPPGDQTPGTLLTYTINYENVGDDTITNVVVYDAVPRGTVFRVGSVTMGVPPRGIRQITVEFSNDDGKSWGYEPISGGEGAPIGCDAAVTHVRWIVAGTIEPGSGSNAGLGFSVLVASKDVTPAQVIP